MGFLPVSDFALRLIFWAYVRVCVGRHLADASIWAAIVSILSVFDIAKAKDEMGLEIEVPGDFTDGIAWWVSSFSLPEFKLHF